jgi:hypothetical protein
MLPRPACGERVGVRGFLSSGTNTPLLGKRLLPLARNPRADARIPTSPRRRGEVTGRAANSFTASEGGRVVGRGSGCAFDLVGSNEKVSRNFPRLADPVDHLDSQRTPAGENFRCARARAQEFRELALRVS